MLVGARDLDPPEEAYLADSAITTYAVADLEGVPLPEGPLYVHVGMDVADPAELPGLRYAPDGPALTEVAGAVSLLRETERVAAIGLACSWPWS